MWCQIQHYSDVIMTTMASLISGVAIVCSTVCLGADKKKTSKLRVTGLCAGNSPGTGEFPAQMASNAENVSIWWRHHVIVYPRFLQQVGDGMWHNGATSNKNQVYNSVLLLRSAGHTVIIHIINRQTTNMPTGLEQHPLINTPAKQH